MNNAKNRPEDAIMSINSFIKDIKRGSPMIKALALRTLGCLGVHKLNEYLIDITLQSLQDEDPYVRKTAVLAVAKIYLVSPELCDGHNIE